MRAFSRFVRPFEARRAPSRFAWATWIVESTSPSRLFSTTAPWFTHGFWSMNTGPCKDGGTAGSETVNAGTAEP